MKGFRILATSLVGAAVVMVAFALNNGTVAASPPLSASIRFGLENVGSPFPPPSGHDRSSHAMDSLVPRTVVISEGGSVTSEVASFHQVAIYDAGTTPDDITISPATLDDLPVPFPPFVLEDFIIDDPDDRIALGPALSFGPPYTWTSPAGTFDEPGRYLVICTVLPHFAENDMYGWVIVK